MKEPILITGCARSGTSMVAGIINMCGAWGGEMSGPTRYNQKGMFENADIRNILVKPFFRAIKADPMGQHPLPDIEHITIQKGNAQWWQNKVIDIFNQQGLKNGVPWFYKGAKMCLIWPLWARAFPSAKWIIVRRHDQGIINSCLKTSFMHAFDDEKGWQYWVDQHKRRFNEMYQANLEISVVWPSKMIEKNDFSEMKAAINWLGLTWKDKEVQQFISPNLWHHKEQEGKDDK